MDSGLAARSQVYAGCVNLPALRRPGMTTNRIKRENRYTSRAETPHDQIARPTDIGKRAEGHLLPGGARPALLARGLRPPVRQYAHRRLPQAQSDGEGPDLDRRRSRDLGVAHDPALSRGRAWAEGDRSDAGRAQHGRALD